MFLVHPKESSLMRFFALLAAASLIFQVSTSSAQGSSDPVPPMPPEGRLLRLNQLLLQLDLRPLASFSEEELRAEIAVLQAWVAPATQPVPESALANVVAKASYPHFVERLGRSTTSKFELIEQSNTVLVQSGSASLPSLNPTPLLFRFTGTAARSELIPSVSDVALQVKTLTDAKVAVTSATSTICKSQSGADKLMNCVLRTGIANRIGRIVAGEKDSFIYGQNPEIQQGIAVAGTAAASTNYSISGQVDLDPKGIFLNGSDLNTAYPAIVAYGLRKEFLTRIQHRCDADAIPDFKASQLLGLSGCARKLAGMGDVKGVFMSLLLPDFNDTIRNNFDFLKQGGLLVAASVPTPRLQDVLFTVDLSKLIPSAKNRSDAIELLVALGKPTNAELKQAVLDLFSEALTSPEYSSDPANYAKARKALIAAKSLAQ